MLHDPTYIRNKILKLSCSCCQVASVVSDTVQPHRWQPTRLPHPWDPPGKNTGVGCRCLLQCVKVKSLSHAQLVVTPWTAAYQAPPSMGFSRQEYWSGLPFPSPYIWVYTPKEPKSVSLRDIYTPMFIAVLLTIKQDTN